MDNMTHIEGRCKARSIDEHDDYCNKKVVEGGQFCREHTCIVQGCKEESVVEYPLLQGRPHFCSKHNTQSVAGRYGCDTSTFDPADPWDT